MDVDVLIIGGGVVGLACALESARRSRTTLLIERHESFGQETSSRNSEVIHSGIYYPTGSLKARLCPAGNTTTYNDCAEFGVWISRCGKLVVAVSPEEEPEIERLFQRGTANGVQGLRILTGAEARKLEPAIQCTSALDVPSTGILDSHGLMNAYLREAKSAGADVTFGVEFTGGDKKDDSFALCLKDTTGEEFRLTAGVLINAAGVEADRVARSFGIDIDSAGYRVHPNRGHYYRVSMSKSRLVSRLVYPVPNPRLSDLGIHITLDRSGQMKLGPDAEYLPKGIPSSEWYKFDDSRREKFYRAVSRYFPALEEGDLAPDQVGVRSKIQAPGAPATDFVIRNESERGLPGLVNLIGIESPGLTCAREIAREVFRQISHDIVN
jgi:L-2-hydroxyglutarate oxidase LhgO